LIKNTNEAEAQIKVTNGACNKCYHALGHILKKRHAALPWQFGSLDNPDNFGPTITLFFPPEILSLSSSHAGNPRESVLHAW